MTFKVNEILASMEKKRHRIEIRNTLNNIPSLLRFSIIY